MKEYQVSLGTYYGRSGSYFFHSLLDGHSSFMVLPYVFRTFVFQLEASIKLNAQQFADKFVEDYWNAFVLDEADCKNTAYADLQDMKTTNSGLLNLDESFFKKELVVRLRSMGDSYRSRFVAVHEVVLEMLGYTVENRNQIFYQLHTPHYRMMRTLSKELGPLKIFHSARDPIASFVRLLQIQPGMKSDDIDVRSTTVGSTFRHFLYAGQDLVDCPECESVVIRLEDLHAQPRATMAKVAEFLNIEWEDILLEETINNGANWKGVEGFLSGFNLEKTLENNSAYRSFLTDKDITRLEIIAKDRIQAWGYTLSSSQEALNSSYDFTEPYAFELFPFCNADDARLMVESDPFSIRERREELHDAVLKVINYLPRQSGSYCRVL